MSGESSSSSATAAEEETAACCDCCGLVEECTPAYEARVRERYGGRWICGLCGEAVEEELLRSAPISADEALARHATFCRAFRSAAPPAPLDNADHLIAALRHLLRRSLDSPRLVRSTPSSPGRPTRTNNRAAASSSSAAALARSESCFTTLAG
ncbi:hypothetical protein ACMD2_08280 [Ananas comosus]|nr:hypothetical protein ACMD2_08280 [Ananas comosus]